MNKNYILLHLDDNPDITEQMYILFRDSDIDYRYAYNTEQASKELKKSIPDLLIVDLMLEDNHDATTGADYIKQISKEYPDLKILVLSARGDQFLRDELNEYIVGFETKIFRPSKYKEKILKIVKGEYSKKEVEK